MTLDKKERGQLKTGFRRKAARRRPLCVLLSVLLALSLAACGSGASPASQDAGNAGAGTLQEQPAESGTGAAAGAAEVQSGEKAADQSRGGTPSSGEASGEAAGTGDKAEIEIPEKPYFRDDGGVSLDVFAMDTYMTLLAYGDHAEEAVRDAAGEIHRLDDLLSTGNPESEISKLNAAGGGRVSDTVEELIGRSQDLRRETGGLFEIAIYPIMKLWGFPTQEFRVPEKTEIEETLKRVDASKITISDQPAEKPAEQPSAAATAAAPAAAVEAPAEAPAAEAGTAAAAAPAAEAGTAAAAAAPAAAAPSAAAETPAEASQETAAEEEAGKRAVFGIPGMEIDLGGIAKGYTSSRVMEIFREHGIKHGLVSLGGNVQALGTKENGKPWRIAIRDPESDVEYLGVLDIEDKCVITSGGYERFFDQDGVRYHHIIDPRTGFPADSGILSATIISRDGALADGLSTALYIMGKEKAEEYWRAHPGTFDYILEDTDGVLYVTEGAESLLTTDNRTVIIR